MTGNLCRCATYVRIRAAIHEAATGLVMPSRRQFLRSGAVVGMGLLIGLRLERALAQGDPAAPGVFAPNAFVRIAPDNTVTIIAKHIEFGQGAHTGLATLLAEELDADWSQIRIESAPADVSRYNNLAWGPAQGTGGSSAMANSWEQLRRAGATARAMLVAAAAQRWQVPATEITVEQGVVAHPATGRRATFGELAAEAARQTPPAQVTLKDPKDFKLIGRSAPRVDSLRQDERLGRLHLRPSPARHAHRRDRAAAALRRHRTVVRCRDGAAGAGRDRRGADPGGDRRGGTGHLARHQGPARAADRLGRDRGGARGTVELAAAYRSLAAQPGARARWQGDPPAALAGAARVLEAVYEFPYLAHTPMEPLDCVVRLGAGECDMWVGSQSQTLDQMAVAAAVGLPPAKVRLHTMLAGGSFGRRSTPRSDELVEAVSIARALGGARPIKVVWTREDDVQGGFYRPLYVHRLRAGLDAGGRIVAWEHRIVGQSIVTGTPLAALRVRDGIDLTSVEGASELALCHPEHRRGAAYHRRGHARALVALGGQHPYRVLDRGVPGRAGPRRRPRSRGPFAAPCCRAIPVTWACSTSPPVGPGGASPAARPRSRRGGARVLRERGGADGGGVAGRDGLPRVERVVCAVDCGIAVNPDVVRAQMEGSIGFGLGSALWSEITVVDGRVQQSNFHDFRILRIEEMPRVEVHIVPSAAPPTGVGEPGVPPIAPAVANAWLALTGGRPGCHRLLASEPRTRNGAAAARVVH